MRRAHTFSLIEENPQHKQLVNVVEEMAIAAGMGVPPVYLIGEDSINAFVFKYPRCGCLDADAIWRLLLEQPGIEMSIKCASERVLCRVVRQELRIGRIIEEIKKINMSKR